jgi:nucleotide-binding universal stress UspA family protein
LIARGGRIDLVHCWQMPWATAVGEPFGMIPYDELQRSLEGSLAEAAERLRATVLRDRADVELGRQLVWSSPTHGLVDAAAGAQADLVVVGSHGRRGVRRLLLGSVAEVTVRHAHCSVLVAR